MDTFEQLQSYFWVLLALGLGGLVGLEREFRGHEAGIRTTALVCAGAALFSLASAHLGETRISAGVVQGIGFLGAGLVFQRGDGVKGVTTAATIWVMASVGLLVGYHLWLTAVLSSATFVVLLEMAPISDWVLTHGKPYEGAHDNPTRRHRAGTSPAPGDDAPRSVE
ncbi:MAG: MgtC/SapB family protein [Dehalococcoidia bacterium]|nr:MgtC/SapB family protein [Dehalococcoidia bacterium]